MLHPSPSSRPPLTCCEQIEPRLLAADGLAKPHAAAALQQMCDALEQGCAHLQLLAKPSLSELTADTNYARGALSAAATRLLAALRRVVPRAKDDEEEAPPLLLEEASFSQSTRVDAVLAARPAGGGAAAARGGAADEAALLSAAREGAEESAEQGEALAAAQQQLAKERKVAPASDEELRLVQGRNELLEERVEQMSALMDQQLLRMQQFMKHFPVPVDEAERRLIVADHPLMRVPCPHAAIEAAVDRLMARAPFGDQMAGLFVGALDAHTERMVATRMQREGGGWLGTGALHLGFEAMGAHGGLVPKKMTCCQVVVATGEMVCLNKKRAKDAFWASGPSNALGLEPLMALAGTSDTAMGAFVQGAEKMGPAMEQHEALALFFRALNSPDIVYSGAPLRLQGRVVGTLCVFLRGIEGDGDIPVAMKAVLEAEAAAFNADLNAVVW